MNLFITMTCFAPILTLAGSVGAGSFDAGMNI
jgi:hypothetical protein